jgi:hypothetical protein
MGVDFMCELNSVEPMCNFVRAGLSIRASGLQPFKKFLEKLN